MLMFLWTLFDTLFGKKEVEEYDYQPKRGEHGLEVFEYQKNYKFQRKLDMMHAAYLGENPNKQCKNIYSSNDDLPF